MTKKEKEQLNAVKILKEYIKPNVKQITESKNNMKDYVLNKKTLEQSQADDLKIDNDEIRVWISRCENGADGQPLMTVEYYNWKKGCWLTAYTV